MKRKDVCNNWKFNGVDVCNVPTVGSDNAVGFTYIMTLQNGMYYIGKKFFYGKSGKESNWKNYYSSSNFIKDYIKVNGKKCVSRDIISYHFSKWSVDFAEMEMQFIYSALKDAMSINDNIAGRYFRHKDFFNYDRNVYMNFVTWVKNEIAKNVDSFVTAHGLLSKDGCMLIANKEVANYFNADGTVKVPEDIAAVTEDVAKGVGVK